MTVRFNASTTETLTDEVPISIPSKSIFAIIKPLLIKTRKDERIHPSFLYCSIMSSNIPFSLPEGIPTGAAFKT